MNINFLEVIEMCVFVYVNYNNYKRCRLIKDYKSFRNFCKLSFISRKVCTQ